MDRSRARSGNLSELDGPGAYTGVNKHEVVVHLVQNFHLYEKKKRFLKIDHALNAAGLSE